MPPKLTLEIINAAIEGLDSKKRRINDQITELRTMLPGGSAETVATPETAPRKRRKFSATARRRMREAQQRRWAKVRGESEPSASPTPEPKKPKRRISEGGLKRIIAATKKRWRLQKAAAKAKSAAKAKRAAPARRKAATKKAVVKSTPAKAAKRRAPVNRVAKKSAPAPAPTVTEGAAQ
jgi:hypothetical protein